MSFIEKLFGRMTAPKLTRGRIAAAMAIACVADLLQIALMPVAWTFAQSAVDVVAMVLAVWVMGFHLLLLPTFIIEFVPGVDILPTWTACMIAVIALRKREQSGGPPVINVDPAPTTKPTELSLPTNPTPNPPPPPARD